MVLWWSVVLAFSLDKLLGEPKRLHPLIGFGVFASFIERHCNRGDLRRLYGVLAICVAIVPLALAAYGLHAFVQEYQWMGELFAAVVLYIALGWQSLLQHAVAVVKPLKAGEMDQARQAVAMLVSRDTQHLDATGIATAATESVLENGSDAIFAVLFGYLVAGVPGVVVFRLSNTLDAMWGYKNAQYLEFGWAAARLDDVLNFIPARLTALSYALVGNTQVALRCWQRQARHWHSPNAGSVMAAGAGALNVCLGGVAQYQQQIQERPALGPAQNVGQRASAISIEQACHLVNRSVCLWLVLLLGGLLMV